MIKRTFWKWDKSEFIRAGVCAFLGYSITQMIMDFTGYQHLWFNTLFSLIFTYIFVRKSFEVVP